MGQALAFRNDLNARENFLDTAERRDSVVRLANLVGYTPKRNSPAQGYIKIFSVATTENITDFNGINLSNVLVDWNDATNPNWFEQFTAIINAALVSNQRFGRPANRQDIQGIRTDEYGVNLVPGFLPVIPYTTTVDGVNMPFEAVSATSVGRDYVYEPAPRPSGIFNILYRNDQLGFGSASTGFFLLFKQGVLQNQDFNLAEALPNRTVNINIEGSNQEDHCLDQEVVLDARPCDAHGVALLEGIQANGVGGHLARDDDHGDGVHVGRGNARDRIREARATGHNADARLLARSRIGVGRMHGGLFVPHEDVLDLVLLENFVVDVENGPTGVSE